MYSGVLAGPNSDNLHVQEVSTISLKLIGLQHEWTFYLPFPQNCLTLSAFIFKLQVVCLQLYAILAKKQVARNIIIIMLGTLELSE